LLLFFIYISLCHFLSFWFILLYFPLSLSLIFYISLSVFLSLSLFIFLFFISLCVLLFFSHALLKEPKHFAILTFA
jgi:hypothetical protein